MEKIDILTWNFYPTVPEIHDMQKNQHTASIFATATQLSLSRENLDIKRVTFLLDET
jgi:hypothetical protein